MSREVIIGFSRGSPCCICGKLVGGTSAMSPLSYEGVYRSQSGRLYCGECGGKRNVGMFGRIHRHLKRALEEGRLK